MRNLFLTFSLSASAIFSQTPVVSSGGIVNHFSYAAPGLPNGSIAQGSIFDIYGTNLGPAQLTASTGFPIPQTIAGSSVEITVAASTLKAFLFFVSRNQIAGILPSKTPAGTGILTVTVNGERSAPVSITVVPRSIGILSLNKSGSGPAVMQMPHADGNVALNSVDSPARPGQIVVFYGTGAGPVTFDDASAAPLQNLTSESGIRAYIGGVKAEVHFLGRTPGLAGLDQFNVSIPSGVSGCYVPVVFRMGDVLSNYTTISVSPAGPCPDPIQLPPQPTSGQRRTGNVQLVHSQSILNTGTSPQPHTNNYGSASFIATDYSKLSAAAPSTEVKLGSCTIGPVAPPAAPENPSAISFMDAGPILTVIGPNGTKELIRNPFGYAAQLGAAFLSPGAYIVDNGSGGSRVGPFRASVTTPAALTWINERHLQEIPRTHPWEVRWTGSDSRTDIYITGTSLLPDMPGKAAAGTTFTCRAPANAARFTIPELVLLALPPSTLMQGTSTGSLSIRNSTAPAALVPVDTGGQLGLDNGEFTFSTSITRDVVYK